MRRYLPLLLLICFAAVNAWGFGAQTKARLLLSAEVARPGDTVLAAVHLEMPTHWHTYWRNPGESGKATKVDWQLPDGISAGAIQWPAPEKHVASEMTTYVYHDEVILLVPLQLANTLKPGSFEAKAKVSWLECEEQCIPGSAQVSAKFTVGDQSKPSGDAAVIEGAKRLLPRSGEDLSVQGSWEKAGTGDTRPLILEWTAKGDHAAPDFFPYAGSGFEVQPAVEKLEASEGKVRIRKLVKKLGDPWPTSVSGLLIPNVEQSRSNATEVVVQIATDDRSTAVPIKTSVEKAGLLKMLFFAFLGGLILNVMPCVLPVIALKILGFVQQNKDDRKQVFRSGLIYALGVLCSFAVIAVLVVMVKGAGTTASWGMHMQNVYFRIGMTVLMLLVALNLFGLFEVTLRGKALDSAAQLSSKKGNAGSFFNGILAVALGASCTAPVLVSAVGYAFTKSAPVILLFFLTIGAGMAFPYVLLSWRPEWLRFLPKPGLWMEKFKVALGFPVLATAVWLFSITAASGGADAVWGFGVFLVSVTLAAWIWGEFVQRGRGRKVLAAIVSLVLIGFGYAYGLEDQMEWRSPRKAQTSGNGVIVSKGLEWHPWSAAAVEKARAEGHPVLVDFTADWCPNCKANKRRAIDVDSVRNKLKETGTITMIGDFTDHNPAIAAELQRFERSGVPLVLVYPRDPASEPIVLPSWLTASAVLEALDKASK